MRKEGAIMARRASHRSTTIAFPAFLIALLSTPLPLPAQDIGSMRLKTPGTDFNPAVRGVTVDDVPGGRRFRGRPGDLIKVWARLRIPASSAGEPALQRLAVHFRSTSPNGPTLRVVDLHDGNVRLRTLAGGDYSTREVTSEEYANAWVFPNTLRVGQNSIVRLEIQLPIGFDSAIDPGEFVLLDVTADFPRKPIAKPYTPATKVVRPSGTVTEGLGGRGIPKPSADPTPAPAVVPEPLPTPVEDQSGVIYALGGGHELLWYHHIGRTSGTPDWTVGTGKQVGTGWSFRQLFSGGYGVLYAITPEHDLLWYRHDGILDGMPRWAAWDGKKIGSGWSFERVFSGGDGVIYAITSAGDLLWFRHDGFDDGSSRWAAPEGKKIGEGWGAFTHVFAGGGGVIYAVTSGGDLLWHRHDGRFDGSPDWAAPQGKNVGTGWTFRHVFSAGDGVIYAVDGEHNLLWYRHEGHGDGTARWTAPHGKRVGTGWTFGNLFSGAPLGS